MKFSEERLKHIFNRLQKGKVFYGVDERGMISKYACIYRTWNDVNHTEYCLAWQNFGSSANSNTIKGLKFICEKIFDNYTTLYEMDK